jgi:carbon-monoxide dehydrogenase large subunit
MSTGSALGGARSAQYVGARVQRREDPRLLLGDGQFVDDLTLPGMLHAAFLRSTVAHARIRNIDSSDAVRQPGVVAVFTGADLASWGVGPIVALGFLPDMPDCAREPLPTEKIRHVGEAIAVVVARSRYIAEDACDLIRVDVERLPAVVDPETALQADAPVLHEEMPSNLVGYRRELYGDPDRVFAEADHVFKKRFVHGRVAGVPIEARGVIGEYDRRFQSYTVWSATQVPHLVRPSVSASLGVSEGHVRVIAPDVGGGFGIKSHPFIEEVVIPAVAKVVGAPVKWIEDRYEHLAASVHAKELVMDLGLAVASDGTFLAMRGSFTANSGAYGCFPQTGMVDSMCAATLLPGLYRVEHVELEIQSAYTNKSMTGTYRGVGWGAGHTAREVLIDDAARALGRDPLDLRLQNFIPSEPYTNVVAMHYDGGSYHESVRVAREELGYESFRARQAELRKQGRYVGIGFSPFIEPAGIVID